MCLSPLDEPDEGDEKRRKNDRHSPLEARERMRLSGTAKRRRENYRNEAAEYTLTLHAVLRA